MKVYVNDPRAVLDYPQGTYLEEGVSVLDSNGKEVLTNRIVLPQGWTEIEIDSIPQRPKRSGRMYSIRLVYREGSLLWEQAIDKNLVVNRIAGLKAEMNARAYKTEKHIQGLLTPQEWEDHKAWCALKRTEINELEKRIE